MAYQYHALSDPDAKIRLALIEPGFYNDEIRVSFQTRRLEVSYFS